MNALAGTGSLVRNLALRRDRIMLAVWILAFVLTAASSAGATVGLYDTGLAPAEAASAVTISTRVALYGLIYDPTSLGALASFKLGAFGGAIVAVFAILLVIRHTRAEEEAGRLQLVGSAIVGRHAPLAAALIVTVGACLSLGLLTGLGLIGSGLPAAGSLAFGLAWAGIGIAFACVAAVAAQITSGARAAIGIAMGFLGVAYVLRAIGYFSRRRRRVLAALAVPDRLGAAGARVRRGPVVAPGAAVGLLRGLTAVAYALVVRRDHGAGLMPDRLGPADAGRSLGGAYGLAWRLQRGLLFGWLVAFTLLGFVFGNIATNVSSFTDSPAALEMIQKLGGVEALTDAFMSTELGFVAVILPVYGIQVVMRLRSEESELRAESVLATGVSRYAWAGSHIVIALLGTTAIIAAAGLAAGLSYSAQTGHAGDSAVCWSPRWSGCPRSGCSPVSRRRRSGSAPGRRDRMDRAGDVPAPRRARPAVRAAPVGDERVAVRPCARLPGRRFQRDAADLARPARGRAHRSRAHRATPSRHASHLSACKGTLPATLAEQACGPAVWRGTRCPCMRGAGQWGHGQVHGEPGGRREVHRAHRGPAVRPQQRLGARAARRRGPEPLPVQPLLDEYAQWHLGLTEGANDETKARYAFVYGDFRRVHRTGLIACVYRASEWRHKEVELAAHDLLQLLDKVSAPAAARRN